MDLRDPWMILPVLFKDMLFWLWCLMSPLFDGKPCAPSVLSYLFIWVSLLTWNHVQILVWRIQIPWWILSLDGCILPTALLLSQVVVLTLASKCLFFFFDRLWFLLGCVNDWIWHILFFFSLWILLFVLNDLIQLGIFDLFTARMRIVFRQVEKAWFVLLIFRIGHSLLKRWDWVSDAVFVFHSLILIWWWYDA